MRNKIILWSYSILLFFIVWSCNENKEVEFLDEPITHSLTFDFGSNTNKEGRNEGDPVLGDVSYAIMTISDTEGNTLEEWNRRSVPLQSISGKLLSVEYQLIEGQYSITECVLYDVNGNDLFAAPREPSSLASSGAVSDPLPIEFYLSENGSREIRIEVVSTLSQSAEDFGYDLTASFLLGNTFDFYFTTQIYDPYQGRIIKTDADVFIIKSNGDTITALNSVDRINRLLLGGGLDHYRVISKKRGYKSYDSTFSKSDIKLFNSAAPLNMVMDRLPIPSSGIIAFFPFDGSAKNTVNNQDGVFDTPGGFLYGQNRFGIPEKALQFSNTNTSLTNENIDFSSRDLTISMWISPTSTNAGSILQIGSVDFVGDRAFSIRVQSIAGNQVNCIIGGVERIAPGSFDTSNPSFGFSINSQAWRHLAVTRQDSLHTVYIDGVQVLQNVVEPYNGDITVFGRSVTGNGFLARIDDVFFYNKVLTPDEIFTLFLK